MRLSVYQNPINFTKSSKEMDEKLELKEQMKQENAAKRQPVKPKFLTISDLSKFTLERGQLHACDGSDKKLTFSDLAINFRKVETSVYNYKAAVAESGTRISEAVNKNTLANRNALQSIFEAAEILEKRIINSDNKIGSLSRNHSRMIEQNDILWGQQAKINNSFRQFAVDRSAHFKQIDKAVGQAVGQAIWK